MKDRRTESRTDGQTMICPLWRSNRYLYIVYDANGTLQLIHKLIRTNLQLAAMAEQNRELDKRYNV